MTPARPALLLLPGPAAAGDGWLSAGEREAQALAIAIQAVVQRRTERIGRG